MNDDELIALGESGTPHRTLAKDLGWTIGTFAGRLRDARKRSVGAKILVFDIETSLVLAFVWGARDQFVQLDNIVEDWHAISWAAKWLNENKVMSACLTPAEAKRHDDKRVIKKLWKLFNEANVIIAHNGDNFDIKKMNWRWLVHGLNEPLPYKTVDTLKVSRQKFGATSKALDYLTSQLQMPNKTDTNMKLWRECFWGDSKALKKMHSYNRNDVVIGEAFYLRILPYISNHPNLGLYSKSQVCRNCASPNLVPQLKMATTPANVYRAYRCSECGKAGRYKQSILSKEDRARLVV